MSGTNGAGSKADVDEVRAQLRADMRRIKERRRTGRLSAKDDSKLLRVKAKLTALASTDDAGRRQGYLEESSAGEE